MKRNLIIAFGVVFFHIAALWAMQNGLQQRTVEQVVPAEILVEFIELPTPQVAPPPPTPKPTPVLPTPVKQQVAKAPVLRQPAAPELQAVADATPSPQAPVGVIAPAPVAAPIAAPVAAAPPAPARVELPSSAADYLHNPKPPYPGLSKRLGEQGKVVVRVLISVNGTAQQAEIKQSSGFDRLDQAALDTVLRWRYVPGKRAGVPETMWFNVPISFVLE